MEGTVHVPRKRDGAKGRVAGSNPNVDRVGTKNERKVVAFTNRSRNGWGEDLPLRAMEHSKSMRRGEIPILGSMRDG